MTDVQTGSDAVTLIAALSAACSCCAAVASWVTSRKLYKATSRYVDSTEVLADSAVESAETSRVAALLQLAPLPIPWIDMEAGARIMVDNHGLRPAHNIEWHVQCGDDKFAGRHSERLPAGGRTELKVDSSITNWLFGEFTLRSAEVVITLRFQAPWGQDLSAKRIYPVNNEPHWIEVTDGSGRLLRLEVPS